MLRFRVREVAEQRGLTPRQHARLTQIDPKTILALWYNPYRDIKASTLSKCANALNISLHDLVEEQPGEAWSPLDQ
jgi:DNA-binding Xre family transcriptional regulator